MTDLTPHCPDCGTALIVEGDETRYYRCPRCDQATDPVEWTQGSVPRWVATASRPESEAQVVAIRQVKSPRRYRTCEACGTKGRKGQINAHHITPRSEGGSDKGWNLMLLCKDQYGNQCHLRIHQRLGYLKRMGFERELHILTTSRATVIAYLRGESIEDRGEVQPSGARTFSEW